MRPTVSAKSSLAGWSLGLSIASVLLGPFGCIPGIVCGHAAKSAMRRNTALRGAGLANAGLIVGYFFLILMVVSGPSFVRRRLSHSEPPSTPATTPQPQAELEAARAGVPSTSHAGVGPDSNPNTPHNWPRSSERGASSDSGAPTAGSRDYSVVDPQDPTIPSQPAQGTVLGQVFNVRRAMIEGADLVLKGDAAADLPEIRLSSAPPGSNGFFSSMPKLLENAARFGASTLILANGKLGQALKVTLSTQQAKTDLTREAGIRLMFRAPQGNSCKTSIHLALGPARKEYLLGEFVTELPPELAAKVRGIKSAFQAPVFRRGP